MDSLEKYFNLISQFPHLFINTGEKGELTIITDPNIILREQEKIINKLHFKGDPEEWIDIGVLAEDEWFWVIRDLVQFPDGGYGGYIRMVNRKSNEKGGFNVILICNQNDKILMIKKYRHESRDFSWEFPRGFGEPNLDSKENAEKETLEEIGVQPKSTLILKTVKEGEGGTCIASVKISPTDIIKLEKNENIVDYSWLTSSELDQIVIDGKLSDWFTLWAYSVMKNNKRRYRGKNYAKSYPFSDNHCSRGRTKGII